MTTVMTTVMTMVYVGKCVRMRVRHGELDLGVSVEDRKCRLIAVQTV